MITENQIKIPIADLIKIRDEEIAATIDPVRQQTIVGETSGAGDRHVLEAEPIRQIVFQR